jgi:hypothetical protein
LATILDALDDPALFAPWFRQAQTWHAWRAFLAALFALPMTAEELSVYRACTGREEPPTEPTREGWLVCGRRAGKSFILALIAVWLAIRDYSAFLAPGERATILILASDKKQARVILRYVRAMLTRVPLIAALVERETEWEIELSNSVTIEVGVASYRSTRGYAFAAVLADELSFWPTDDASEPDYAVLDAVRPGMATLKGVLLCASSPYARRGALWDAHRRYFGKPGPVLVWQAATRTMNPLVEQSVIDAAMERDPASAASEYLAQFREDLEAFISLQTIEAATDFGIERRPVNHSRQNFAFVDVAGGSGTDSYCWAVGHVEDGCAIIDLVEERKPPFSPEAVTRECVDAIWPFGVRSIRGDKYAGDWPREAFRKLGIEYLLSDKPVSEIYRDALPWFHANKVRLVDNPRLRAQYCALERRVGRSGKDLISHPPNGHDDLCNVVSGVVDRALSRLQDDPVGFVAPQIIEAYPDPRPKFGFF